MDARVAGLPEPEAPRVWQFSKFYAQKLINKYLGSTAHSLRHTRATHCITINKMNIRLVAEFFRIAPRTLSEWVMRYSHLETEDLKSHLREVRAGT
jgi:integrase